MTRKKKASKLASGKASVPPVPQYKRAENERREESQRRLGISDSSIKLDEARLMPRYRGRRLHFGN